MFILESLGGDYAIDISGRLERKGMCKPKKFFTEDEAKVWAKQSGIRTPLLPVDERETDGY